MKDIYEKIYKVLAESREFNKQACLSMQAIGYQGLKRIGRYNACKLFKLEFECATGLFDKYREKLSTHTLSIMYNPIGVKEHLIDFDKRLYNDIHTLGELNKEHFNKCGKTNHIINDTSVCISL